MDGEQSVAVAVGGQRDGGRVVVPVNRGWRWKEGDEPGFSEPQYDDRTWELVDIPHTVHFVPDSYFDDQICSTVTWYRMRVIIPPRFAFPGALDFWCACLHFEAVSTSATVYVNGTLCGGHKGGYTPFDIDITKACRQVVAALGGESVQRLSVAPAAPEDAAAGAPPLAISVAVRVDSTEDPEVPPFGNVVDYLAYGGIYREVSLCFLPGIHISELHVKTPSVLSGGHELVADLDMTLRGQGFGSIARIVATVYDDQGMVVGTGMQPGNFDSVASGGGSDNVATASSLRISVSHALLWELSDPVLYRCTVVLVDRNGAILDAHSVRFGFRDARFTAQGFFLNGRLVKLVGLDRHQSYPVVGYAAPASMQADDADFLRRDLGCTIVRTSHYPQHPAFLDRCDEIGLLVFTEIPGWQHIGTSEQWRSLTLQHVREMIIRDRNHPSVVLWGVRINESPDDDALYTQTNELAHALDPTRQTAGVRNFKKSHLLEDVYTYNDFLHDGKRPALEMADSVCRDRTSAYLVTEHNGHMFPVKTFDTEERRLEHALRHARVLDAMMGSDRYCGAIGWCMADYHTHRQFGSGDMVCHHGVADMYRAPKMAGALYASQVDADVPLPFPLRQDMGSRELPGRDPDSKGEDARHAFPEVGDAHLHPVMAVSSQMAIGEHDGHNLGDVLVFTNCDCVDVRYNGDLVGTFFPDRTRFAHMPHPPVVVDDLIGMRLDAETRFSKRDRRVLKRVLLSAMRCGANLPLVDKLAMLWILLRYRMTYADGVRLYEKYVGSWDGKERTWTFEGKIDCKVVISQTFERCKDAHLELALARRVLVEGDTYDMALLAISVHSQTGSVLQYAFDPVSIEVSGPVRVVGSSLVSLVAGTAGVLIRTSGEIGNTGPATVAVHSSRFGSATIELVVI